MIHYLEVLGRVVLGLGMESALETGLTLHHTYGVPILRGSAIKGVTWHYCQETYGAAYNPIFGAPDDAGHITFEDAWITPASLKDLSNAKSGLLLDVMTPHHQEYY